MAEISGLGNCGICFKPIQDPATGVPSAVRHYQGHQLAHKECYEKWTMPGQRLRRAEKNVASLEAQLASIQNALTTARAELQKLKDAD